MPISTFGIDVYQHICKSTKKKSVSIINNTGCMNDRSKICCCCSEKPKVIKKTIKKSCCKKNHDDYNDKADNGINISEFSKCCDLKIISILINSPFVITLHELNENLYECQSLSDFVMKFHEGLIEKPVLFIDTGQFPETLTNKFISYIRHSSGSKDSEPHSV